MPRIQGNKGHEIMNQGPREWIQELNIIKNNFFGKVKKNILSKVDDAPVTVLWIKDTEAVVLEKLHLKGEEEEVVSLICLYMLVLQFFFRYMGDSLDVKYMGLVKDLKTMQSISFHDLIHELLMEGIKTINKEKYNIINCSGCIVYLLVSQIRWLLKLS